MKVEVESVDLDKLAGERVSVTRRVGKLLGKSVFGVWKREKGRVKLELSDPEEKNEIREHQGYLKARIAWAFVEFGFHTRWEGKPSGGPQSWNNLIPSLNVPSGNCEENGF